MSKKTIILLLLAGMYSVLQAETYVKPLGLQDDSPSRMNVIPRAVPAFGSTGSDTLPGSVDLSPDFPPVGYQGMQSSCVAWSVAYAVKSYQEKIERGWSYDESTLFSPAYIYNQINGGQDRGSVISEAMQIIIDQGAATLKTMPYNSKDYWTQPNTKAKTEAGQYKGLKYSRIDYNDLRAVKSYLSQGIPIVFGISIDDAFYKMDKNNYVYKATGGRSYGGHAMALVGYDDNKHGGAFKLINSWGTYWGDQGYAWIPYTMWTTLKPWSLVMYDLQDSKKVDTPTPGVPAGLSASQGEYADRIVLSWKSSDYAQSYYIYRWSPGGSTWDMIKVTEDTSYTDKDVKPGQVYSYYIQAANLDKKSRPSSEVQGSTKGKEPEVVKDLPSAPVLTLSHKKYTDKMDISWTKITSATEYALYYWEEGLEEWKFLGTLKENSYTHQGLKADSLYYYLVFSYNKNGYSGPSEIVSAQTKTVEVVKSKPGKVEGLSASQGDYPDRITLSWNPGSFAEEYIVYRWSEPRAQWVRMEKVTSTQWEDTKIKVNTLYYYTVISVNSLGSSSGVNPAAGFARGEMRPRAALEQTYSTLFASQGIFTSFVLLQFDKIPDDEKYVVYRRSQKDPRWVILEEVTAERKKEMAKFLSGTVNTRKNEYYVDKTTEKEIIYQYKVAPLDLNGSDIVSPSAVGWIKGFIYSDPPAQPANLKIDRFTKDQVTLAWKPGEQAQGYYIYLWDSSKKEYEKIDYTTRTVTIIKQAGAEKLRFAVAAYNWAGISEKLEETP